MSVDADFRRQCFALEAEGLSHRAIGRALDSNHVTVAKVLREPPPIEEPLPAHMAPPQAPPGFDSPGAPALQVVRELLNEARR